MATADSARKSKIANRSISPPHAITPTRSGTIVVAGNGISLFTSLQATDPPTEAQSEMTASFPPERSRTSPRVHEGRRKSRVPPLRFPSAFFCLSGVKFFSRF